MATMARKSKTIVGRYSNVPSDISTSLIPEKTFTDEVITEMHAYNLSQYDDISVQSATILLKQWLYGEELCNDSMPYLLLRLAISLQRKLPGGKLEKVFTIMTNQKYTLESEVLEEISATIDLEGDSEDLNQVKLTEEERAELQLFGDNSGKRRASVELSDDDKVFGPFVSGFLLKMCVKDHQNVQRSWGRMKETFINFFTRSKISDWPTPDINQLKAIKGLLVSDPLVMRTWVKYVSMLEAQKGSGDINMITYLAILPFSFTGMHAYKLTLAIKKLCNFDMQWFMEEMACPETIPALDEIYEILIKWENTKDKVNFTPYYRYARVAGPEYFQKLQTKNCPALVYLLVSIVSLRSDGGESYQNPENIVGIGSLSNTLKDKLKTAARMIIEKAPEKNKNMYSETLAQVMGKNLEMTSEEKELFGD